MKKIIGLIILLTLSVVAPAFGEDIQINVHFNDATGDNNFATVLDSINAVAANQGSLFIDDLSSSFNVPATDIALLMDNEKIQPADAFMIFQLAEISGKPLDQVIQQFRMHRDKGWGTIAQSFGIKPGSDRFFLLKENIPQTMWKYKMSASEQDLPIIVQFNPATGDSDFDIILKNINAVAGNQVSFFVADLSSSFNIPTTDIDLLMYNERIQPADAFMIFQLVKISGKPLGKVLQQFRKHRNKGWGAIALSFGIKPGSDRFFLLKENIPQTMWKYKVIEIKGSKGSKGKKYKKGSKGKKHKKGSKGSKGKKHKKGSKGKKDKKHEKGSKGKKN